MTVTTALMMLAILLCGCPTTRSRSDGGSPADAEIKASDSGETDDAGTADAGLDAGADGGADSGADAGLDGGADAGPLYQPYGLRSGTRIKARWVTTAEGARSFYGWWDSALGEPCSFSVVTSDGVVRCVPPNAAQALVDNSHFADPALTQPVFVGNVGGALPAVVARVDATTCPSRIHFQALGARLANPDGGELTTWEVYPGDAGAVAVTTPVSSTTAYYPLGAEVPPDTWVGAAEVSVELGALRAVLLEGEDTSTQLERFDDLDGGFSCWFGRASDGVFRCLPWSDSVPMVKENLGADFFTESSCSTPAAIAYRSGCVPSRFVYPTTFDSCGRTAPPVHELGPESDTLFYAYDQACYGAGPQPLLYRIAPMGLAVPEDPSQPIDEDAGASFGRLRAQELSFDGGAPQFWGWFDTHRGETCGFAQVDGGAYRCLPSERVAYSWASAPCGYGDVYGDAACTHRIALLEGACTAAYGVFNSPGDARIFSAAAPYLDAGYVYANGSCCALSLESGQTLWELGAEIPASEFVPGTLSIE